MNLPEFDYLEPRSVGRGVRAARGGPAGSAVFAGGTDVLVDLKERARAYRRLVSLRRIELPRIAFSDDDGLVIGAMATVNQVARHESVRAPYPGRRGRGDEPRRRPGAQPGHRGRQPVQRRALGGHGADPAGATARSCGSPPPAASGSSRWRRFFIGPRATVLRPDDVLVAIELPPPGSGEGAASSAPGRAAVAVAARGLRGHGWWPWKARSAAGPRWPSARWRRRRSWRPAWASSWAASGSPTRSLAEAGRRAAAETHPIDDVRSAKEYRLER